VNMFVTCVPERRTAPPGEGPASTIVG
jgi:hypothetical protein